ncbi:uncharacterized protein LOC112350759 [Selaginella moellendorffii]|uniref:uncharacterized protein LOC112350200 n=1 Tax=Selaginella moellendorffii TaxID=88036 RepID=UPI000D1D12CA|nr:uncharacterized protein LOC112350200 [Selaginella moellendorffii]XP_024543323.1 uncharacterized protein LOC112350759 [Selaginella moellendorffii]|eukprot:XP_024541782.1 uncharacterized protein LOC112350200 [Selaginella moellendorffii]
MGVVRLITRLANPAQRRHWVPKKKILGTPELNRIYNGPGVDQDYVNSEKYKTEILQAKARIFNYVIGNGLRSGHKILRRKLIGPELVKWYPFPLQHLDRRFKDPTEERRYQRLQRLKRAGKGRPKKGQGKRATAKASKKK